MFKFSYGTRSNFGTKSISVILADGDLVCNSDERVCDDGAEVQLCMTKGLWFMVVVTAVGL